MNTGEQRGMGFRSLPAPEAAWNDVECHENRFLNILKVGCEPDVRKMHKRLHRFPDRGIRYRRSWPLLLSTGRKTTAAICRF